MYQLKGNKNVNWKLSLMPFTHELCDLYRAEKQLLKALPKMIKKANREKLVEAFTTHLEETKMQVERVEAAFEDTDKAAKAKKCEAMAGLIEEAEEMMAEEADPEVMDAVIIGLAQKVEHYEIATLRHAVLMGSVAWVHKRQGTTRREPG